MESFISRSTSIVSKMSFLAVGIVFLISSSSFTSTGDFLLSLLHWSAFFFILCYIIAFLVAMLDLYSISETKSFCKSQIIKLWLQFYILVLPIFLVMLYVLCFSSFYDPKIETFREVQNLMHTFSYADSLVC